MTAIRKTILLFVTLAILCAPLNALSEGGFASDPDRIEAAVKSVLMLDVYGADGEYLGSGSGFVAFDSGTLVTNYHVIADAATVVGYSDDGDRYEIDKIYIADEARDVAILGFTESTNIAPLTLNADGVLKRAQTVVAIGSPIGLTNTVSIGNISALYEEGGVSEIQFTAPISPGSSGGALFDDNGDVIGITSAIYLDAQNINLAVHAREVTDLYAQWDGTRSTAFSAAPAPTTAATTPTASVDDSNIRIVADALVWCEAGEDIQDSGTAPREFGGLAIGEIKNLRDARDPDDARSYYVSLTFAMETGTSEDETVVFQMMLYRGADFLGGVIETKSFGRFGVLNAHRYFDVTELMRRAYEPGTYTIVYLVGGVELGRRTFEICTDGATSAPTAPESGASPAPRSYDELRFGDRGDGVAAMQRALIDFDYLFEGADDGVFGKKTRDAVVQFNLANELCHKVSGVYDSDPEVASEETLRLLYEGAPVRYAKPAKALYLKEGAYAEWYELTEDIIMIHFEVTCKSAGKTVKAFELSAFAIDAAGMRVYENDRTFDWRTVVSVKPGETINSSYVRLPDREQIALLYVGITRVYYEDGTADYFYGADIDYVVWEITD